MKSHPESPVLSVVVVILGGPVYLARCLQGLLAQSRVQATEIIVPCDEHMTELAAIQKKFPSVSFLSVGGRPTYAELRAFGVFKASGTLIALTEDHCTPDPDWCERILQAHGAPFAVVGGAVEKTGPDTAVNWALYLADYGRYMNPKVKGFSSELTDCNVSYKRAALYAIAEVWKREFHEPAVHAALRARGEALWFSPDIIVRQQRSMGLGAALRDRYRFGRLFGSGRVTGGQGVGDKTQLVTSRGQKTGSALLRRLIYAGGAILLPPILVGRIAKHVFRRRCHIGAFLKSAPALLALNSAWAWGEFLGYLTTRAEPSLTPARSAGSQPQEGSAT